MNRLIYSCRALARALAWVGVLAIILLSIVPAIDRPVTGTGQWTEHFAAFALVAGMFAVGYRLSLVQLVVLALIFCGGIELLQITLPTRHARLSDFTIDFVGIQALRLDVLLRAKGCWGFQSRCPILFRRQL